MKDYKEVVRTGSVIKCPFCVEDIVFTWLVNWDPPVPFFYSNLGNDVALKKKDCELVDEYFLSGRKSIAELEDLWNKKNERKNERGQVSTGCCPNPNLIQS